MIISRTPVRVSFCGGGTDIDSFSMSEPKGGRVVSLALDRHIHVTVNPRFDDRVRLSYSKMEIVDDFEDLEHELAREAMRMTGVTSGVEITTIADIPSRGTGLGSSSAVTVGLLNALHAYAGRETSAEQLASEACEIEIDILGQPIGRQDQYAAAFGGINSIRFDSSGVSVDSIEASDEAIGRLSEEFTLVFTGMSRSASEVLGEVPEDESDKLARLRTIREQADQAHDLLVRGDISDLGSLIGEAWNAKRGISASVSGDELDTLHERIMAMGATGAKLLGAGGGGFFLVHGDSGLRKGLSSLGEPHGLIPLNVDWTGSEIIHNR
ncbi:MAG: GHMP kinase [Candidatus Thermoplasmatota archaeon]|nr:GHMP kinase [Candidatus Thermoplasmatota archaeon]MEE3269538.1 GHMP kinase [Candidatus Thermoplasmatota archaeon]